MKAFQMNEKSTYAAHDKDGAIAAYRHDHGQDEEIEDGYPRELSDAELDEPWPDFDEDENLTGSDSSIREWLGDKTEPGFLCGTDWQ